MTAFTASITAEADDIDIHGHVNNAVWVRWIQDVATLHWYAVADPQYADAYIWIVTRHEIDYLRPLLLGQTVEARTEIEPPSRGVRTVRHMEFIGEDGKPHVRARTEWVMVDRATSRPLRVPPELLAPFLSETP